MGRRELPDPTHDPGRQPLRHHRGVATERADDAAAQEVIISRESYEDPGTPDADRNNRCRSEPHLPRIPSSGILGKRRARARLRIVIGSLLLIYGLQWTTKAILRASGAKAKHDEELIYANEVKRLREEAPVPASGLDGVSFAVSFKGVLLEGLEVAFIVITFGTNAGRLAEATLGAVLAVVLVVVVGIFVHRPLSRVPENGLKFAVGLMLITFGTFWAGEGIGIEWPASDATILILLVIYAAVGMFSIWTARRFLNTRRSRQVTVSA